MRRAFTLIEVLIAMAIFTIGIVAVAGVLSVAARMQKNTIKDIISRHVSRSVSAILNGYQVDEAKLLAGGAIADGEVYPVDIFTETDRTHPVAANLADRPYEWHTFARFDADIGAWFVYALVGGRLIAEVDVSTATGDFVTASEIKLHPGDYFLDSLGNINKAASYSGSVIVLTGPIAGEPVKIWYTEHDALNGGAVQIVLVVI